MNVLIKRLTVMLPSSEYYQTPADPVRIRIDNYLANMHAIRQGLISVVFLQDLTDGTEMAVTTDNVDEAEANLRNDFGAVYPDLVSVDDEKAGSACTYSHAVEIAGYLKPGSDFNP